MRSPLRLAVLVTAAMSVVLAGTGRMFGQPARNKAAAAPHYHIYVVDVSGSMICPFPPPKDVSAEKYQEILKKLPAKEFLKALNPPSDPEGIRWDGLQFAIDVAAPSDRVALVLFAADATIVTNLVDENEHGYVELGKNYTVAGGKTMDGRTLLKTMIDDLQKHEGVIATSNNKEPVKSYADWLQLKDVQDHDFKILKRGSVKLTPGTSVFTALQTIEKSQLLDNIPKDRSWVLLFTDGQEEFSTDDYFKRLRQAKEQATKSDQAPLNREAASWVRKFTAKGVPIITFAIGTHCDDPLLESLARQSNPKGAAAGRGGAAYQASTNYRLLGQLQRVVWELRKYWWASSKSTQMGEQDLFKIPKLKNLDDVGLLLYQKKPAAEGSKDYRATAPTTTVDPLTLNMLKVDPLQSRSHWYYPLTRTLAKKELEPPDRETWLAVNRPEAPAETEAVLALRPKDDLFTVREPLPDAEYTPLDAIPFQVDFTPPRQVDIEAKHFTVTAYLSQSAGARPREIPLLRQDPNANGTVPFRAEHVMYDFKSKGRQELKGPWRVQIKITANGGILDGAARELLPRTIKIIDYPLLGVSPKKITLTNLSKEATGKTFTLRIPRRSPQLPTKEEEAVDIGVEAPREFLRPLGTAVRLRGGARGIEGTLAVSVDAKDWAKIPLAKKQDVAIKVTTPWDGKESEMHVELDCQRYELRAPEKLIFSPRGKDRLDSQTLMAALITDLPVDEEVWLNTEKKETFNPKADPEQKLRLTSAKTGGTIDVQVRGLGMKATASGAGKDGAKLSLTLSCDKIPDDGEYTTTLFLVGPGVEARSLTLAVRRNLAILAKPADLVFDLVGSTLTKSMPIHPRLLAGPAEEVWLSSSQDPFAPKKEKLLKQGYGAIELEVGGLSATTTAAAAKIGGEPLNVVVTVRHKGKGQIPKGEYKATLYLVGRGVAAQPLNILVRRTLLQQNAPDSKEVTFDLYGTGGSAKLDFHPTLMTQDTKVKEQVWLSRSSDAQEPKEEKKLKFSETVKGENVEFEVNAGGVGVAATAQAEKGAGLPVTLTLPRGKKNP